MWESSNGAKAISEDDYIEFDTISGTEENEFSLKFYKNGTELYSYQLGKAYNSVEFVISALLSEGITEIDAISLMYRFDTVPKFLNVMELTLEMVSTGLLYPNMRSKNSEKAIVTEL